MQESDLFKPIEKYLKKLKYDVHAEVKNCDIIAEKDNEMIIIELKKNLSVQLLAQAADRQKVADFVYIAYPKTKINRYKKKTIIHLLRRLELGAIEVDGNKVQVIVEPAPFVRRKSKKRKNILQNEIQKRNKNYNIGGISKKKIITAYRIDVIKVAGFLSINNELTYKQLRELGCVKKVNQILTSNYYGWFQKVERATFKLSPRGFQELKDFITVINDVIPHESNLIKESLESYNEA